MKSPAPAWLACSLALLALPLLAFAPETYRLPSLPGRFPSRARSRLNCKNS